MGTAVIEYMDGTVLMTHHDHRLPTDYRSGVIPRIGDLGLMADINPGFVKDLADFTLKDLVIGITIPMHPVRLDQRINIETISI
jgi:hypothetical protein